MALSKLNSKTFHFSPQQKGVIASVIASCLFALLPLYVQFQPDWPETAVAGGAGHWLTGQRILWSAVIMLVGLTLVGRISTLWEQLKQWRLWPRSLLSACLIAPQFWLFIWAPLQGEILSVALGYFALPLVLVAVGYFVYGEQLTRTQVIACFIAACGVVYAYVIADGISWIVFVVALGYPLYFMNRRRHPMASDLVFTLDNLFLLPFALLAMLYLQPFSDWQKIEISSWVYYLGLGLTGTLPMLLFLYASQMLPLSLFGLLTYLEPTLVFCVGLLLGERVELIQWPIYGAIMLALVLIAIDSSKRRA
ncbi:EamA family transporter RarD [Moritella marina]|uniref:EamA family transporter RarD n=1 Tax=Moritella marina TaxID=90736 RepID=UPI003703858C